MPKTFDCTVRSVYIQIVAPNAELQSLGFTDVTVFILNH